MAACDSRRWHETLTLDLVGSLCKLFVKIALGKRGAV